MSPEVTATTNRPSTARTLGVILLTRFALNVQVRMSYPFLPEISRGLGLPLTTVSLLLSARALVGMTSPLFGLLADRYGRRAGMVAGLLALIVGAALVALTPSFGVLLLGFALLGMAKASYDPAMQAYLGDRIPYGQRGRIMALTEMSWSGSWLLGIPAAGFMIAAAGWRSPYVVVAVLGGVGLLLTWRSLNGDPKATQGSRARALPGSAAERQAGGSSSWAGRSGHARGTGSPRLWALPLSRLRTLGHSVALALAVGGLLALANENTLVVYGAWLESGFGLSVSAVGLVSIVVALAELTAESASAGLVDRLGKRRAVVGGMLLNVAAYLLLPRVAGSLAGALAGFMLVFLTFEFSIVSLLPLVSELAPAARGTVLSLNLAAMGAGRLVASLVAPRLWSTGGIQLNTLVSAGVMAAAALMLWWGVREGGSPHLTQEDDAVLTGQQAGIIALDDQAGSRAEDVA